MRTLLWRKDVVNKEVYLWIHAMRPVFVLYFKLICSFLENFHSFPWSNITEILTVGSTLMHEDKQKDMTKRKGALRDNATAPTMKDTAMHFAIRGSVRCHRVILVMKGNEMHYFSDLLDKVLYMFRTSALSIIRSNSTLHTRNRYLSC